MNNSNKANLLPAETFPIALFSNSELFFSALKAQLLEHASFALQRCKSPSVCGSSRFRVLLVDTANIELDQAVTVCKNMRELSVALINATEELALEIIGKCPHIKGVFYRSSSKSHLVQGLETMIAGGDWLPRALMEKLLERYRGLSQTHELVGQLSDRERQVLILAGKGLSNLDIANSVHLSVHTVKSHIHNALCKLGASNRAQAAAMVMSAIGSDT